MVDNVLIEASAGTGKTQALAERLIELLRQGVKPQEIVALTFSRAAAGEIFERFVTLLAKNFDKHPEYAAYLREVIATQHLSQIGTLDSFLMRIVRAFPLELGLMGPLEMMDAYEQEAEQARISFGILRRTDAAVKREFNEAFQLVMNEESVRSFVESYHSFIKEWHRYYLAMPDSRAWGDATKFNLVEMDYKSQLGDCANELAGLDNSALWSELVEWVRNFRGAFSPIKGLPKKLVELGAAVFEGSSIEVFYRKDISFTGTKAVAIRKAMKLVYCFVLQQKVEMARGIYALMKSFETDYARKVRQLGRLTFDDVPRLICGLNPSVRQALEYRLDLRIGAWALDEFQDTSRAQWNALFNLIDEARQSGGEKSVFIVGDSKQAIYGWREGDVRIFANERQSGAYACSELKQSWRYGQPIVDAINAVFVNGRLSREFLTWHSPLHETAKPELDGFVHVFDAPGTKKEDFVEPVFNAIKAVDPVGRGITAAVLVRDNGVGRFLTEKLRQRGLKNIVWEGESSVLDTPALFAFMDVLALADHPGDKQAYEHFRRSTLASAKYGAAVPSAEELSTEFALSFSTKGLVRTFRELRAYLPRESEVAWSKFTEDRFTDLLRAAAEFELSLKAGVRLGDFVRFLKAKQKRNVAEPGKIKVLTIHRSKGLGFDYVILPLYESRAINREPTIPLVGEDWILPNLKKEVIYSLPGLRSAGQLRKDRTEQEELCAYYVAMTRAKRAMTIITEPAPRNSTGTIYFSEFVREAIPNPLGNPMWYKSLTVEKKEVGDDTSAMNPPVVRAKRVGIRRRLPSLIFHTGESASNLFAPMDARRMAMMRGTTAHAEYEKIEFITAAEAKTDFERALVKPDDFVALWRERPFEIFANGEWVSGRFDRVVFTGKGESRAATIYDFKTNRKGPKESTEEFARRMQSAYRGQMEAYRQALVQLTGISNVNISMVLLLTDTAAAVSVD